MYLFKDFPKSSPEDMGISSTSIIDFLTDLEKINIPMHSVQIMRHGNLVFETYYKPYTKSTLHRMFSVTKSFVSIGIGLLEEEGKLSLDDKIIDYFPEKLPKEGVHPYIAAMTIRDMLRMASAHDKTTYKTISCDDWVKTFFCAVPSHLPGTCFSYDTSSTHTLSALIEKLSGMELLEYLRKRFLNTLDFSEDTYCLKDPSGISMGGSGLVARPYDLLKFIYLISKKGNYEGVQLLPEKYIKDATAKQIDTSSKSSTFEEMQGYGYQFWRTTHNGIVCFGMGGQLALYLPDKDLILVTTADTQGRQGGVQLIYDSFWRTVYANLSDSQKNTNPDTAGELEIFSASRTLPHMKGSTYSPVVGAINNKTYALDENSMGFSKISLSFTPENKQCNYGELHYSNKTGEHTLKFNIGSNCIQNFPYYNYTSAVSGAWLSENTFVIKAHIIDECVGSVLIQLVFKNNMITVMMRKFEETFFNEFDGFCSGKMI